MFNTIVRVTVTLWTFVENMTSLVWTFVDSVIKQLWVCANRLFSSVTFWQVAALAGWAQVHTEKRIFDRSTYKRIPKSSVRSPVVHIINRKCPKNKEG